MRTNVLVSAPAQGMTTHQPSAWLVRTRTLGLAPVFTKSIGKTHLPTNLTVNLRGCRRQEQVGVTGSGHVDAAQPGEGKDRGGSCGDSRQRGQEAWPRSEAHCVQVLVLSGGLCVTRHPGGTGLAEGSSMERSWTRAAAPRHSHLL